jgi:16S rRNA (guanine527-N7)-methyltransferase
VTPKPLTTQDLAEALGMAQRVGALGRAPIDATIAHARGFVAALSDVTGTVLDLGSGGGVPGLVIAVDRPDLRVVLVDRRENRSDLCRRLVAKLALTERVDVVCGDAADLDVLRRFVPADAVVARGFGPASATARHALPLLASDGLLIVSEPPSGTNWDESVLSRHRLRIVARSDDPARVVSLTRSA